MILTFILLTMVSKVQSQITITVTNIDSVQCFGQSNGSITVSASGGTPSYTYLWNSTPPQTTAIASNLPAGTYTVTVNDAVGNSATQSATVYEPTELNATIVNTDVLCHGLCTGTATVTASGGTPPYYYNGQTNPVATGLCAGNYFVTVTDANGCITVPNVTILEPAQALQSFITVTNVACFNQPTGCANLTVIGGTPGYTYHWMPGNSNLQDLCGVMAGTYTVTVTDENGCTLVDTAIITQPATPLSVIVTWQNLVCYEVCKGFAVAIASGGTPGIGGYTYIWDTLGCTNDTLMNVCPGQYSVTATDGNGCNATGVTLVVQPPQPAPLNFFVVDVLCYGDSTGMIELNYADIQPTNTYQWTDGVLIIATTQDINNLCAGWYQVTVTTIDSCIRIANITVNQPADPLTSSIIVQNVQCYNDSNGLIDLTVNGGTSGYTYIWSPQIGGITVTDQDLDSLYLGTDSMTYYVTITDANGCMTYDTATIYQPQTVLNAAISSVDASCPTCNDGTATAIVTGGITPYTYSWNTSPAQNSSTAINLLPGTYIVTITDGNGCSLTDSVVVSFNNNINEVINSSSIIVYPNPADENIEIKTELQINNIEITDITGRLLYTTTAKTIDCSGFAKGVYFVKVKTDVGIAVKKFIKE